MAWHDIIHPHFSTAGDTVTHVAVCHKNVASSDSAGIRCADLYDKIVSLFMGNTL